MSKDFKRIMMLDRNMDDDIYHSIRRGCCVNMLVTDHGLQEG